MCSQKNKDGLEEKVNRLALRLGTGSVGEAAAKLRKKRHPDQKYDVIPVEDDEKDKNHCSLISDRNKAVHIDLTPPEGKSFLAQFLPVAQDLQDLLDACDYFIANGREEEIYKTLSMTSFWYLKASPDLLIDYGHYCIENFGKPTPEDKEEIIKILHKLYKINKYILEKE